MCGVCMFVLEEGRGLFVSVLLHRQLPFDATGELVLAI